MTAPVGVAHFTPTAGIDFGLVTSDQRWPLGSQVHCADGRTRRYVRAGAAITADDALKVDYAEGSNDFDPTSATIQPIAGIAEQAFTDNYYGWVVVEGAITCNVATPNAGDVLVSSASAGRLAALLPGAAYSQTENQQINAAAAGRGAIAITTAAANRSTVLLR